MTITSMSNTQRYLNKQIITSYHLGGFTANKSPKVKSNVECDYYAMMEGEVAEWSKKWRDTGNSAQRRRWSSQPLSANDFLGRMSASEISEVAKAVSEKSSPSKVGAVSSFAPELAYNPWVRRAKTGRKALRSLILLADKLVEMEHPVVGVEIGVGSVIRGVRYQRTTDVIEGTQERYVAILNDLPRAQQYLCQNLRKVLSRLPASSSKLAIELEPGAFFLARDLPSLKSLNSLIMKDPILREKVFFNLDISHWRLAGIAPEDLRLEQELTKRVLHAHISGHHPCAHFGDIPLLDLNSETDFDPWLDLLEELKADKNAAYEGGLSLELEAVRDDQLLNKAISEFIRL